METLGAELSRRPVAPPELLSPLMLERVHESAAEFAEAGPMGDLLAETPVPMPAVDEQPQLDSVVGASARRLAGDMVSRPEPPSVGVWSAVRSSILDDITAQRGLEQRGSEQRVSSQRAAGGRRSVRWPIVAATLAASVTIATVAVQLSGVSDGTSEPVSIVFTELEHPPDVEFAVLRFGGRR